MELNKDCRFRHTVLRELYRTQGSFYNPSDTSNQLFLMVLIVLVRLCVARGAGVHQWDLPMDSYIALCFVSPLVHYFLWLGADSCCKWLHIVQILYAPALFLAKTTILLQYLNVFAPQKILNPFMWYGARIIIIAAGTFYCVTALNTIFACSQQEAIWNPLVTTRYCRNNPILILAICLFNIFSDVIILILPATAVWKMRISTRQKIRIVALFAIGLL